MKFSGPAQLIDRGMLNACCYESETGRWRMQFDVMLTGSIRLHLWCRDWPVEYLTEYCLGEDQMVHLAMAHLVKIILANVPEEADPKSVGRLFPEHTVNEEGRWLRPITTDPFLVQKLGELAGFTSESTAGMVRIICGREDGPYNAAHNEN